MFARCQMLTVANVGAGNVGDLEVRKQQPNFPLVHVARCANGKQRLAGKWVIVQPGTAATGVSTRGQRFD